MDIATLVGILLGMGAIIGSILLMTPDMGMFVSVASFGIVFGGEGGKGIGIGIGLGTSFGSVIGAMIVNFKANGSEQAEEDEIKEDEQRRNI